MNIQAPVSVRHGGKLSTRFLTTSGVRQGCVLAPALFCVAIDWILNHMDANPGIKVGSSFFTDLVYADDTTLFATSSQSAVESLSSFQNAASVLGMHISWPKTKVQGLGAGQPLSDVSVDARHVECVDNFTCLGSVQLSGGCGGPGVGRRIALAASVVSSLSNVWGDRRLSLSTGARVCRALVVSVLCIGGVDTARCWCRDTGGLPHGVSTADPPRPLAGSRSRRRGRRACRPAPCGGEHRGTT